MTRWCVPLILIVLALVVALWIWYRLDDPSSYTKRVAELEAEAEGLAEILKEARQHADKAREELRRTSERLEAERAEREAERRRLEVEVSRLRREVADIVVHVDEVETHPELDDVELAERAVTALGAFTVEAPLLAAAAPGVFEADRAAVEAALGCTERFAWCREGLDVQQAQVERLEALLAVERDEVAGWAEQYGRCADSDRLCHAALDAATDLERNHMLQLEARAEQVKRLERRLRIRGVQMWVGIGAAAAGGFWAGRQ